MLIGQGKPGARRIHLEQRSRAADDRVRRCLFADHGEAGDLESLGAPGDLARLTVEPIGADLDLDGFDTDECHASMAPFRGRLGRVVRGTRSTERLFGNCPDTRPNMCSMSSVVWRNLVDVRVPFAVTTRTVSRGSRGRVVRHRRPATRAPVEGVPWIAFE